MVAGCIGNTIKLGSGVYFDLANPSYEQINIDDIANALSKICRFGGHCKGFYSVAEHCVLASHAARAKGHSREVCEAILLHDAAEAYIGDMVKPLKIMIPQFSAIEKRIEREIEKAFVVDFAKHSYVINKYDLGMLFAERKQLFGADEVVWSGESEFEALDVQLKKWSPHEAYLMFIDTWQYFSWSESFGS